MRIALAIAAVLTAGACDFQPGAPKRVAPEPAGSGVGSADPEPVREVVPTPPPPAAPRVVAPPIDAGSPEDAAAAPSSAACEAAAAHYAQLMIDHATDPQIKAQYVQANAEMVKSTAATCVRLGWLPAQLECMTGATSAEAARDCVRPPARRM
ncbi:MAG TPA: hypothetical protein VGM88_26945 [Kofleriaceae bacterium]